ncbi:MAG: hypothetical protein L3J07_02310 [Candidatus Magasanikbacteria bacterium]|nr:hypothetical protein [Candidatus Magasanikbacteria bacterium]
MQNSFRYPGSDSVNKERINKFRDIVRTSRKNHIEAVEKFDKMLEGIFVDFLANRIPENERAIRRSNFKVKFWGLVRRYKTAKMSEREEIENRFLENWNYMIRPLHGD